KMLNGRRYPKVLEIGCAAGCFTRMLAPLADYILALDVAPAAIDRARAAGDAKACIEFRVENIMDHDFGRDPAWDLIVMSETIYYLGWLYSFFDTAWLAHELFESTVPGGKFIMANTWAGVSDYLMQPWIIRTYRDLFFNTGYRVDAEDVFQGQTNGATLETL